MLRAPATPLGASVGSGAIIRLRRNVVGASAVEFALILPVMLALYAGFTEMAHAIDNWRKVTLLARTIADLTSQGDKQNPISTGTMNDIFASSTAVLRPFVASNAKIVVSALAVDLTASLTNPRVCSSTSSGNTSPRIVGVASDLKIPPGFGQNGARYVLAEVSMTYTPMVGTALVNFIGGLSGSFTLKTSFPWPTRGGQAYNSTAAEVILPGGAKCP